MTDLRRHIRDIPDFPKPGIVFKDITPLLADPTAFRSTVDRFVDAVGVEKLPPLVACIGPITAETAARHAIDVDVVAEVHTIPGLVDELVDFLDR